MELCSRGRYLQCVITTSIATAAGRCKRRDGLSCQIILLKEGVDDVRRNAPPDGESQKDFIILTHILDLICNLHTGFFILHLDCATAFFIRPVKICLRIRLNRPDYKRSAPSCLASFSAALLVTPLAEKYATNFFAILFIILLNEPA